ncbi:MAG: alkylhydroperoxidase [Gammaproteobacteria bacterium HGW-Gammaproteobacteria-3]|nr:MAG: alkylhydroperoxidase [Gammaproteobacteria bacterium HGW-Gammaproteobacteria-3]
MSSEYQLSLEPVTLASAGPEVKDTLAGAKKNLGFVPNMYGNMANAPSLLKSYLQTYELFRKESTFSAAEQEVIFLTLSRDNGCTYCVAAHSMIADKMSGVPADVTKAIRKGEAIQDSKFAALSEFTRIMQATRGLPSKKAVEAFLAAGYSERHILEVIVGIAVKTMSNYSNHLFHTPVDAAFADWSWQGQTK